MRLSQFIVGNVEPVLVEWEIVARTMIPPAETMSQAALRDHAESILLAIADDMETAQSSAEQHAKSRGVAPLGAVQTAATTHGALRQLVGFDPNQLAAEFRAFRATVLRLWRESGGGTGATAVEEITRFNEGVDQALAESIANYSRHVASSRDMSLAVLGHDLRTPLASLSGCLHVLEGESMPVASRQKALTIAHRSVASIDELVTNLLEYTRIRLGRGIEVRPVRDDVSSVCQSTLDEVRAANPNRQIDSSIQRGLTAVIDAPRLRQALGNLLTNAVQHGDPKKAVSLGAAAGDGAITLEVANEGAPIPPHLMQVIFDPLVQIPAVATQPHERPSTSLGLGLFIAREIAVAHGGSLGVTSSAVDGTVFTIKLPMGDREKGA